MKNKFKVLFVIIGLLVVQISSNLNANSLQSIETKDRWKGLGLCVWPGETCEKSIRR